VTELDGLRQDLLAEQHSLDLVLVGLDDAQWHLATPSPGWDVADQIGHLTFFDGTATVAISDPEAFRTSIGDLVAGASAVGYDEFTLGRFRALEPRALLSVWRANRTALREAALYLRHDARIEWYGPAMSARSFLTARLMETWAHGTDVADALGTMLPASDRLRHVAQLGFITRTWSYTVRGEDVPQGSVRVELTGPVGGLWTWGPDDADDVVRGGAEDFCHVVTQRRHLDDTLLEAGELARHWLLRAQAFAGGPTEGPAPRSGRVAG